MSQRRAESTSYFDSFLGTLAELFFVLLPLIVVGLIVYLRNPSDFGDVWASEEWSFGAAVLFGQAIVKLSAGVAQANGIVWQRSTVWIVALIVFGLVPSMVTLALALNGQHSDRLTVMQMVLFVLGVVALLWFGTIGSALVEAGDKPERPSNGGAR